MRVTLQELLGKLSVDWILGPYETAPWSCYDADQGRTCSAEVRMGPDSDEVEAEIQIMMDTPAAGQPLMEHVVYIKATPGADKMWTVTLLRLKGEPLGEEIYNWEEKSCNFFSAVVRSLQLDTIPDIDDLIEQEFHNREKFYDQYGGGGGKSPKIKTAQLMGNKKGGGGF